jgi:cytochrome c oxidase subunit 2
VRRGSLVQLILFGLIAGAITTAVALFIPWLPVPAAKEASRVDFVYWFTTAIAILVFAVVAAVIAYSVLKFRARPDDDSDGPPVHGHTGLEIVWTAIPAVLVTAISIVSAIVLAENGKAGSDPLKIEVIGQQFAWQFKYPNGQTYGILRLPLHRHAQLSITSRDTDVIHSFWVPEFRQKQDAVPGQHNKLVVTPTRTGTFPVICTELCGLGHSIMRSRVEVMTAADYTKWVKGGGKVSGNPALATFDANGCNGCHTFAAASANGKIGPDLDKALGPDAKKSGQPLDPFIRQSIVDPDAFIAPGYQKGVMPTNFGKTLTPAQLNTLVKYLAQQVK